MDSLEYISRELYPAPSRHDSQQHPCRNIAELSKAFPLFRPFLFLSLVYFLLHSLFLLHSSLPISSNTHTSKHKHQKWQPHICHNFPPSYAFDYFTFFIHSFSLSSPSLPYPNPLHYLPFHQPTHSPLSHNTKLPTLLCNHAVTTAKLHSRAPHSQHLRHYSQHHSHIRLIDKEPFFLLPFNRISQ